MLLHTFWCCMKLVMVQNIVSMLLMNMCALFADMRYALIIAWYVDLFSE